jgi:uncharacterized protein YbjT (DUF2867 family)
MIGQGVLREALMDDAVEEVIAIGRHAPAARHPRLRSIVHENLFDLSPIAQQLGPVDACLFCLGVSSVGMEQEQYHRITHDLTLSVARFLLNRDRNIGFLYISGAGTSRQSRAAWARIKAQTEDDLLAMPFRLACMLRPGVIVPLHGIRSRTPFYQVFYTVLRPILPVLRRFPKHVTTTEQLGRAMLSVARSGTGHRILESEDINQVGSIK